LAKKLKKRKEKDRTGGPKVTNRAEREEKETDLTGVLNCCGSLRVLDGTSKRKISSANSCNFNIPNGSQNKLVSQRATEKNQGEKNKKQRNFLIKGGVSPRI